MDTVLAGAGEIGQVMRAIDWPKTSLGPLSGWSQALRTVVGLLLRNRFPMVLWWGPRFVQLYNDSYRSILGDKHPRAMGQPAAECFAEIWDFLGPMIEAPLTGQPATWSDDLFLMVNRKGFLEETHFKVAYSPVPDETVQPTGIGGVLGTIEETTARVHGERQLRTLRGLGAPAAEAKTPSQACELAAATFAENPSDIPFALFYLLDAKGDRAQLASSCGFENENGPANPRVIDLRTAPGAAAWPIDRAVDLGLPEVVADLQKRFVALPPGRWSTAPRSALILPLKDPDQPRLFGFLIAGLSPHRELDEGYRTFFELAAAQVVTAIRKATAHQAEGRRAEALAEIDRAKTVFFNNLSHEFRTPLTLMLGPLDELAHAGEPLTTRQMNSVLLVQRNGQRLLKLVNTLLEFSRIEAGRVHAAYEPTDLALLTTDLASVFRSAIEQGGLRLRVDCAISEPVHVDREMWEKIVLNLLSNALKFTLQGEISVVVRQVAGFAELVISDTGTGIPGDQLNRVFERFYRVEGAGGRSQEGSGIGLALVQELVKLHGGSILVQSVQGRGSAFTVRIPLGTAHLPEGRIVPGGPLDMARLGNSAFVEEASQSMAELPPDPLGQALPLPVREPLGDRILIADGNADMRAYLRRTLELRWTVEAVADGTQALEAVRAHPPALVITDVAMPGLDGFGLLRALREDPATSHLPVILLSARTGEEARVDGCAVGAADYISKPFAARELIARVQAQLALARLRRADRVREEELERLFTHAPFFICRLRGPDHVLQMINAAYQHLFGDREISGRPIRDALPELSGQGHFEELDSVYRTGKAYIGREMPVRLRRTQACPETMHWVNVNYEPARDAEGKIDGVIAYGVDVTEIVESRRKTEALSEQLVLAGRRKDEFLAMLGHELRNPLAPIATAVKLIELKDGDRHRRERQIIERQVTHLARLVDDLLDVSRIARGQIKLARCTVDIAEVAARAVELASPIFELKLQELAVQVPRGQLYVDGDPGRLAQVIANLLTNAGKYTQARGHIALTASREGKSVAIRVKDDGNGIAPDFLPRVFDLFVQSPRETDRAEGGLGLGLALVRNLVGLHGGEVTAASEGLGRGSEFIVRLPAVALKAQTAPRCLSPANVSLGPASRRKILVVDDNVDAAEMLADYLTAMGHEVAVAHDGPEALLKQAAFGPEIGVLDIGLPVMDGYELATRMRKAAAAPLRLVALTGYGQEEDRQRSRQAGFEAHLVKPIDLDELGKFIAQASVARSVAQAAPG